MKRPQLFARNYNWRMLLMRVVINMLALLFTALIVPNIYFADRRVVVWVVLAVALGLLNALVKPVIQLVTLQFIFATGGLVVALINAIMLLLLTWIFPERFVVSGLLWAFVGGAILGIASAFLESLLGLTPPIVSEKYPEIRQRVADRQFYRTQAELAQVEARKSGAARELGAAKALVSHASGSVAQYVAPPLPVEEGTTAAAASPAQEYDTDGANKGTKGATASTGQEG